MADNLATLSKEAHQEILGDDLCFILAFNKNGEIVPYMRSDFAPTPETPADFNPKNYLEVDFKNIPEGPGKIPAVEILALAKYCWRNGSYGPCIGFPCPT